MRILSIGIVRASDDSCNNAVPGLQVPQLFVSESRIVLGPTVESAANVQFVLVLLSNHFEFDNAVNKDRMIAGRSGPRKPVPSRK